MKNMVIIIAVFFTTLPGLEFMPVDDVRPGMKGIGKTVFEGTKIEDFSVEIIGVMKKVNPHSDVILARVSGGPLEKTGVISGMSGSPVYIDGKLVGALAYSYGPFAKEPIAGITPIHEMLQVLEKKNTEPSRDFIPAKTSAAGALQHLPLPVVTTAAAAGYASRFPELFANPALVLVAGGGKAPDTGFALEPGAAVGVQLVTGDLDWTAIGTLTYKQGDRILAFGHPLFSGGSVDLPLCSGFINAVLASQSASYKMASPMATIGRVVQDRRTGIAAVIGGQSTLIPLNVSVTSSGTTRRYRYQVIDHKQLTPNLVGMCAYSSLMATERSLGSATVECDYRLTITDRSPYARKNLFAGDDAPGEAAAAVAGDLAQIMNNRLTDIEIDSAAITLTLSETSRTAVIERAFLDRDVVRPGDTLPLRIFLKPFGFPTEQKTVALALPPGLPAGELTVFVSFADSAVLFERRAAPGKYAPATAGQLIDLLGRRPANNDIVVSVFADIAGATAAGRELPGLPPSAISVIKRSNAEGAFQLTNRSLVLRTTIPTGYVVRGTALLGATVERE